MTREPPHYTPEFVERGYNNRAAVPDHPWFIARYMQLSQAAVNALHPHIDLRYGDGPKQTLDLFLHTLVVVLVLLPAGLIIAVRISEARWETAHPVQTMVPDVTGRVLRNLRDAGRIELGRGAIVLRDPLALAGELESVSPHVER